MASHPHLARIADVEPTALGPAPLGGLRRRLGPAAGLRGMALSHLELAEGERPFPVHLHLEEEEVAYVLRGAGLAWLDGATHELRAGDALSHRPGVAAQAYVGGPGGMELLVCSSPAQTGLTLLPRLGVCHVRGVALDGGPSPREREAALGPLELPAPTPRPATVLAVDDCPLVDFGEEGFAGVERDLGTALGVEVTGLRHTRLDPGARSCPPHWHTAEEEAFVVLAGEGVAWLDEEALPVGPGSVLGRPPRTGVAHHLEAGPGGMTYLSFGTRVDWDVAYYPRSRKVNIGGGLLFRVEPLDYWDGELP